LEAIGAAPDGEPIVPLANIKPRLRMTTLYYYAQKLSYLVAGTGNRAEMKIGYFTKYGDGGVDVEPIIHLTKTQVRHLGHYLGVPNQIISKTSSAGLWEGQTDEDEMGLTYEVLDHYLLTGEADSAVKQRIEHMARLNDHKKHPPLIPPVPPGLSFRISFYVDE
jgi:NAD+ synthase